MIHPRSLIKVFDNSGAKTVRCIKVLGGFRKKYGKIGDILIVSVQQLRNKQKKSSKVKKKEIYKALIIKTKFKHEKINKFSVLMHENGVVLMNKQGDPVGTRIIGPVPKLLRKKKFQKFISISSGLI